MLQEQEILEGANLRLVTTEDALRLVPKDAIVDVPFGITNARHVRCAQKRTPLSVRIVSYVGIVMCFITFWAIAQQSVRQEQLNRNIAHFQSQVSTLKQQNAALGATVLQLQGANRILMLAKRYHMVVALPRNIRS